MDTHGILAIMKIPRRTIRLKEVASVIVEASDHIGFEFVGVREPPDAPQRAKVETSVKVVDPLLRWPLPLAIIPRTVLVLFSR